MIRTLIAFLILFNTAVCGQESVSPEKLKKAFLQSNVKYIDLIGKIDSITPKSSGRAISVKLYPVIKLLYDGGRVIDIGNDHLDMIIAVDFTTKKVYRYDIANSRFFEEFRAKDFLEQVAKGNINVVQNNHEFFTYFFDVDREMADVFAISEESGNLTLFRKKDTQALSMTGLINSALGSYENYLKYRKAEVQRRKVEAAADKIFMDFTLTDNWSLYQQYRKHDTLNCISLVLKDIKKKVTDDPKILNKLEFQIYAYLKRGDTLNIDFSNELYRDLHYWARDMVIFMEKDITSLLRSSLGDSLYSKFKYHEELDYELKSRLENSLITRFNGDWKKLGEFVQNNIKVLSARPFSYKIKNDQCTPLERRYKLYKYFF